MSDLSGAFERVAASLRRAQCRSEIELTEISAPDARAADSIAFSATIREPASSHPSVAGSRDPVREQATGRFLLIHAPDRAPEWGGAFRIVTYVKAEVERDQGHDGMLAQVAWSWLLEALDRAGAGYSREGGTASRVLSEGFGQLADTEEYIDVELRASWTPSGEDLAAHLEAWADMVCTFAGLPQQTDRDAVVPLRP